MDKGVSKKQIALLIVLMPMVFKLAMLPSLLASEMGNDIWLGVTIILALEFLQLAIILGISNLGGMKAFKEMAGKIPYLLVTVPLIAVYMSKAAIFLAETVNFSSIHLFYNVNSVGVTALLCIGIGYVALKGSTAIGRIAEILLWLMPVIFIFGFSFGKIKLTPEYVLPIFAKGAAPVLGGIGKYIFWTFDLTPLLFFDITKKNKRPYILAACIACVVLVVGLYVLFIANYGPSAHLIKNAFSALAAFNVVNTEVGSIDWPAVIVWLSMAIITIAAKIYAAGKISEEAGVRRKIGTVVLTIVLGASAAVFFGNWEVTLLFATSWVRYLIIGIDAAVPVIILCYLNYKRAKNKNANAECGEKSAENEEDSAAENNEGEPYCEKKI